jgi:UDP-N-acetyl-D-mannosaminuronic acid dehydrogenase
MQFDVSVVGGAGHVGLPLALAFAECGLRVLIQDRNVAALEQIRNGTMPFFEAGAAPILAEALRAGRLSTTDDPSGVGIAEKIIVTIGTPVDEYLNPELGVIRRWLDEVSPYLRDDHLIVLRSTLFPGTTDWISRYLAARDRRPRIAFCPERIAQGQSLRELGTLPQLVSGVTPEAADAAESLFGLLAPEIIRLQPMEAEFAKLFTNAYRYISFAIANQFYTLAESAGLDFHRIWDSCRQNYPRMANVPGPGFAAGPCLFKDTMQLAAFCNHQFALGHSAMLVNEGLPRYLVDRLKTERDLSKSVVGILGMAFKAEVDDARASLSYKLKKVLDLECRQVLCSDPYVPDSRLVPVQQVLDEANIIFIGAPHAMYRGIAIPSTTQLIDIWRIVDSTPSH